MSRFASYDGTEIEFRRLGEGRPLVCLPGGPGYADGAFRPEATRAALGELTAPVLIYAGELDFASTPGAAARAAELFRSSKVVVQPGTAHFPWLDDPAWFRSAIDSFLG